MSVDGFIKRVEGIGDVLVGVVESRTRLDSLEKALDSLVQIVEALNKSFQSDSDEFLRKVMPAKFRALGERNAEELQFRLWLAPELMLAGYSAPLDALGKVHQAALDAGNSQAAAKTADALTKVVRVLASQGGNDILLRIALARIRTQARAALAAGDPSQFSLVQDWYVSTVFEGSSRGGDFNVAYLDEMTKAFWFTTQVMILHGDEGIVRGYIGSIDGRVGLLLDGFAAEADFDVFELCRRDKTIDRELVIRLGEEASALDAKKRTLDSADDVRAWTEAVEAFVARATEQCSAWDMDSVGKQKQAWLESAALLLKGRALESVLFSAGSYCLFKNRPDMLVTLVDSHQPEDSSTSWMGWDPFPRDVGAILSRYVLKLGHDFGHDFGELHHGHEHYDHEFSVYLLLRAVSQQYRRSLKAADWNAESPEAPLPEPPSVPISLQDMTPTEVSNIDWIVDKLTEATERLTPKKETLSTLKIPEPALDRLLTQWLPSLFESLKVAKEQRLDGLLVSTPVSQTKVEAFAQKVQTEVESSDGLREFFKYFDRYQEKLDEAPEGIAPYGLNTLSDKAMFFEDWYVYYGMFEDEVARAIVSGEEERVLTQLADAATATDQSIEWCIGHMLDQAKPVIITSMLFDPESLLDMDKFVPTHAREGSTLLFPEELKVAGWYRQTNELYVPIFEFWPLRKRGTLVLDAARLGMWTQYDPNPKDSPQGQLHGFLSVLVSEVAEHPDLVEDLKHKESEWVVKRPSWMSEKDVMKTRVWMRILERFAYVPTEDSAFLLTKDADE